MKRKTIPIHMMGYLRGRLGLGEMDDSKDVLIYKMSPAEIVRECAHWKLGDSTWADTIASWMRYVGCTPKDLQ